MTPPRSPLMNQILTTPAPASNPLHLYNPAYTPAFPATHLLSFLSTSTLLALRQVSRATRAWADSAPTSPFSTLHLKFPFDDLPSVYLSALNRVAKQCRHLSVEFPAETNPIFTPPDGASLPAMPCLERLHILCESEDVFDRLLAFRLALQSAKVPVLRVLEISRLSVVGVLALRRGTFTSFADSGWTGGTVWRGLRRLDVEMLPWWGNEGEEHDCGRGGAVVGKESERDKWRTGIKVLHDWLGSFATTGSLQTIRFEWEGGDGPNPLLLDEMVAQEDGRWFSAPGIKWKSLKEIRLRGVQIGKKDVTALKGRVQGLEMLMVQPDCLDRDVDGVGRMIDRKKWIEVRLEERKEAEELAYVFMGEIEDAANGLLGEEDVDEPGDNGGEGSMEVPFVLITPVDEIQHGGFF